MGWKEHSEKLLMVLGLGLISLLRIGMKNADGCARQVDNALPILTQKSERLMPPTEKVLPPAARNFGRWYVRKHDSTDSSKIDNWSDKEFTNYFFLELGKISNQNRERKLADTSNSSRVLNVYSWLIKYSDQDLEEILNSINTNKDSSNQELQVGKKYFIRLCIADTYLDNKILFTEDVLKGQLYEIISKNSEKINKNSDLKKLYLRLLNLHYIKLYFPLHDEMASMTLNELLLPPVIVKPKT